ncbi:hypothetical protein [Rhodoferax bucti]|uniref:hypothetical protein n=1 Tax=Rhodoferax bucti TaxID=2576305 RepID=UPI00110838AB|nr:hypothetical protein [Rhodoferax bucti]
MALKHKKYFLFRVKFIRDHQKDILDDGASPEDIFLQAINEKPSTKLKRGAEWKLSNIEQIGTNGGVFAVGRISQASTDRFDFQTDEFVEATDYQGPFSTIYFDRTIGVVAIEDKSKVNSKVDATAKRLNDLLDSTDSVKRRKVKCIVDAINDPQGFIQKLRKSTHILKFRATFTGPNPIDADALFQKPLEVYALATKADKGAIEVAGSNLDKEVLIDVTRSNAATGNTVTARIETHGVIETIPLKGVRANFSVRTPEESRVVFNQMRERYEQVRYETRDDK